MALPTDQVIYHVGNSVSVTVRDLDTVGDVLDAAIAAGANSIYGVNFSVDDPDQVMAEARSLAAEDALARAEELAGLHGVALGEVVSVSEVINGAAVPMFDSVNASMGLGSGGRADLARRAGDDRPLAGGVRHRRPGWRLTHSRPATITRT